MTSLLQSQTTSLLLSRLKSLNPRFDAEEHLKKFVMLKTNLDRVNFVYRDLQKYNLFPKFIKGRKDDGQSQMHREMGNDAFGKGDFRKALQLYTASIAAGQSAGHLALAYANRSACLYKLGRYQECLVDIKRAFSKNYPARLKPKLIERRKNAERLLASAEPTQSYHEETPHFAASKKHRRIKCAKNCVDIKTNQDFGRHIVANRDINIGEILCVEKPYASILIDGSATHCHMCLELCYNTIPCDNCCFLLFCSQECKNKANKTFHAYECPIITTLIECGVNITDFIALRTAIAAKAEYGHLDSLVSLKNKEEVYCSDRYKELHNLMPGTGKYQVGHLFEFAITASLMHHFLQNHTDFFSNQNTKRNFKEIVLLQLQTSFINSLQIRETTQLFFSKGQETYAIGLYAFSSLFNHSCSPNVEQIQYGSTMVLRTLNTVKKDQQCFVTYGLTYGQTPKMMRQRFLKEYCFFYCSCMACKQNWKFSDDLLPFKFPLFMDLKMSRFETWTMQLELSLNDVNAAKKYLPHLIRQLRRCEIFEPWGNAFQIKRLISKCYYILGNKKILSF